MKRFLTDIIYVICILICLIVIVEVIQYYVSDNNYSYKTKYIMSHKDSIEGLVLGHSHALRGIDPALLGKNVFNNAESGKWIYYDAIELSKYVPVMSNLRFVIYPIGYDMSQGYLSCHYEHDHHFEKEDNHDYNIHMYAKYEHIPYDRFPLKLTAFSSLLTDNLAFEEIIGHRDCDSLGFEILDSTLHCGKNWDTINLVHLPDSEITKLPSIYYNEYKRYLMNMASICNQYNVRFICITAPCYKTYINKTSPRGIEMLYELIDSVETKYPIEYYNYLSDKEFRADSFYYDCSHLNYIGAEHFTKRLKKDLGL